MSGVSTVHLCVCLLHAGIESKLITAGSFGFHHPVAHGLYSFVRPNFIGTYPKSHEAVLIFEYAYMNMYISICILNMYIYLKLEYLPRSQENTQGDGFKRDWGG